jgi:hypothetical protein
MQISQTDVLDCLSIGVGLSEKEIRRSRTINHVISNGVLNLTWRFSIFHQKYFISKDESFVSYPLANGTGIKRTAWKARAD